MNTKKTERFAQLGLLVMTIIWGTSFAAVKSATDTIPPTWLVSLRFLMAAGLLCVLFCRRLPRMTKQTLRDGMLIGVFLFLAYELQTVGVQYTTAGKNAFLTAVYVVLVPFFYWAVRKKRPGGAQVAAAFLCLGGIGFLSLTGDGFSLGLGEGLTLLCGVAYAVHIVVLGMHTKAHDPFLLNIVQFATAGVLGLLVAGVSEPVPVINAANAPSLCFIGFVSTALALCLQTACQKHVEPGKASLLMSLESVFGCLSGILFLNERLTAQTGVGFVLIFVALLLAERPQKRAAA